MERGQRAGTSVCWQTGPRGPQSELFPSHLSPPEPHVIARNRSSSSQQGEVGFEMGTQRPAKHFGCRPAHFNQLS